MKKKNSLFSITHILYSSLFSIHLFIYSFFFSIFIFSNEIAKRCNEKWVFSPLLLSMLFNIASKLDFNVQYLFYHSHHWPMEMKTQFIFHFAFVAHCLPIISHGFINPNRIHPKSIQIRKLTLTYHYPIQHNI